MRSRFSRALGDRGPRWLSVAIRAAPTLLSTRSGRATSATLLSRGTRHAPVQVRAAIAAGDFTGCLNGANFRVGSLAGLTLPSVLSAAARHQHFFGSGLLLDRDRLAPFLESICPTLCRSMSRCVIRRPTRSSGRAWRSLATVVTLNARPRTGPRSS